MAVEPLPTLRAGELELPAESERWLIQHLWSRAAIGVVAGAPKSWKSWMVLEMATCVAAGAPCLGRFPIDDPGPTLVYLAEDSLPQVRARVASSCVHHHLDLDRLDLHVLTVPSLRLDLDEHQQRLVATVARLQPRLLVLDPLVRLHRLNENDASEISGLLGFLRELQRAHDVAIVLVHHTSKKRHGQQGLALRGSSDLHAFTDSSAYLVRRDDHVVVTSEHRSAKALHPFALRLVSGPDGEDPHLDLLDEADPIPAPLTERVIDLFRGADAVLTRQTLRQALHVNNQGLGHALNELQEQGRLQRTPTGWTLASVAPLRPSR